MDTVFHKIIRGEVPSEKVYEDKRVLVIKDIHPKAPVHLLLLPKEKDIASVKDVADADADLLGHLIVTAKKVAAEQGLSGYKLIFNVGREGGQEVDYLHLHLLGGWGRKVLIYSIHGEYAGDHGLLDADRRFLRGRLRSRRLRL